MSDNSTFVQLQSRQSKLLDGLDELRTISSIKNFEFPQLVVCGSKGSGKSSVLEALSHIHFSGKVEGCTQFATEVIRRRGPTSTFKATLEPGPSCTDAERTERLRSFESSLSTQPFYLPNLLELAKEHLGLDKHQITDDVLKVEISEPYAPNLKIVDLPSLLPSKKEDTDIIKSLTKRYLEDTRSIILAVISAEEKSDLQNVLELASECDPKKERTMSIITHLDCLEPNSEQEKKYIDLIQNDQKSLQLGWHALHCWFYDSRPVWIEERDSKEKAFFSNTRWVAVPREYVGAICLRSRLGDIISNHAQSQIPGLIIDIQTKIANLRAKLDGMGPPRSEINQQRNYLFRISRDFERIVGQALNGVYLDDFFGSSEISDNAYDFRRFRATIRDLNDCFAEAMNLRGSRWRIQEPWETGTTENVATQLNPYLDGWAPIDIDRAMLEARISEHAHRNRGLEPPGNMNNLTVGFLFCEMSEPWEGLAQQHMEMVWGSVHHFIKLLLQCLADARTVDQLMNKVFEPRLCDMKDALSSKLQELMSYLKRGHPLPIGNSFLSRIRRVEKQGSIVNAARITDTAVVDANLTALATITASQTMRNPRSTNTAADILNQMQAYYDSAIVTFVDNVATLGIENCLLAPLEEIFTTQTISEMSDKEVTEIACEPESYQEDHKRISHELDKLKAGLNAIKSWSRNPANSRVPSTLARFYEARRSARLRQDEMAEQGAMTPNKRRCTEAPVRTTSSGSLALIDQNVHPSLAASFSNDAKPKASFMTGINPNNPASPGTPSGSMASLVKPAATSLSGGFSSFAASKTGASIFGGTALKPSGLSHDAKTNTDGSSFKLESRKPSNAGHSAFGHTFGVNPKATGEPTMRPSPADPGSSDIKPETEPQDKLTPPSTKNVDWLCVTVDAPDPVTAMHICFLPTFKDYSPEELRLADYERGDKMFVRDNPNSK